MKCGPCKFSMINSNCPGERNGEINNYSLEIICENCMFSRMRPGEINFINIM